MSSDRVASGKQTGGAAEYFKDHHPSSAHRCYYLQTKLVSRSTFRSHDTSPTNLLPRRWCCLQCISRQHITHSRPHHPPAYSPRAYVFNSPRIGISSRYRVWLLLQLDIIDSSNMLIEIATEAWEARHPPPPIRRDHVYLTSDSYVLICGYHMALIDHSDVFSR